MKKQIVAGAVMLVVLGMAIATIVPLITPEGAGSDVARMLALKLSPIGVIGAITAFFIAKPKRA
jgi:ABC-type proline/glycine betaine transport system permease subunit